MQLRQTSLSLSLAAPALRSKGSSGRTPELFGRFLSTSALCRDKFYTNRPVEQYASVEAKKVTLRQLIAFGRHMNEHKLLKSANYVRRELCVRLAHRIRNFQSLPFIVGTNPRMETVYEIYSRAFDEFRKFPEIHSLARNQEFCNVLQQSLDDHMVVIPLLAGAMQECSEYMEQNVLDLFMDDMLRTRIGRRVLAEQHLSLTQEFLARRNGGAIGGVRGAIGGSSWAMTPSAHSSDHTRVGMIDTQCHAGTILRKCISLAQEAVIRVHGQVPEVVVDGQPDARFCYIPDHIEYILFELLKHALHQQSDAPVTVTVCPSPQMSAEGSTSDSVVFRVSDQGGGIPREILDPRHPETIWSYHQNSMHPHPSSAASTTATATTATTTNNDNQNTTAIVETPKRLAGRVNDPEASSLDLKLGLQLARVFAQYWGGDLRLVSMYGYGTDAYVRIVTSGDDQERLALASLRKQQQRETE